ncbi:MAG: thioredoxin [Janthinobacterium lividum]
MPHFVINSMETKQTFSEIIKGDKPVLVDFFATWCGPCKTQAPILDSLKTTMNEEVTILKIDVDKNPKVAAAYQVQGVPTLLLFKIGQVKWRQSGVVSSAQLQQVIKNAR